MKLKLLLCVALVATVTSSAWAGPFKNVGSGRMHQPSGVIFPAQVGAFQRTVPRFYDQTGRDISIRYLAGQLIIADIYVYPVTRATGGLEAEFRTQQNAIRQINRNVKLISQGNVSVTQNGRRVPGKRATYELERPLQDTRMVKAGSELYVMRDGPWFVACRFSYPRAQSASASRQVSNFLAIWQWRPGTARV